MEASLVILYDQSERLRAGSLSVTLQKWETGEEITHYRMLVLEIVRNAPWDGIADTQLTILPAMNDWAAIREAIAAFDDRLAGMQAYVAERKAAYMAEHPGATQEDSEIPF
jgi:hypothetical protein